AQRLFALGLGRSLVGPGHGVKSRAPSKGSAGVLPFLERESALLCQVPGARAQALENLVAVGGSRHLRGWLGCVYDPSLAGGTGRRLDLRCCGRCGRVRRGGGSSWSVGSSGGGGNWRGLTNR